MAVTRITNVIVPEVYVPYQIELTKETDGFFTSGIITPDSQIAAEMKNGGYTINLPFWNDLSGAASVTSDDPASFITPYNVTSNSQIAVICGMADANRLSAEAIIDAKATMGDAADEIKIIAMNSWVYHALQKKNLIDFIPDARGEVNIPTYMGLRVVVNDGILSGLNGAAVTQTVFLFAPVAIGYGEFMPKGPVAEERD